MRSKLPHILALCVLPGLALSQGVPTNDSGLTARDIVGAALVIGGVGGFTLGGKR